MGDIVDVIMERYPGIPRQDKEKVVPVLCRALSEVVDAKDLTFQNFYGKTLEGLGIGSLDYLELLHYLRRGKVITRALAEEGNISNWEAHQNETPAEFLGTLLARYVQRDVHVELIEHLTRKYGSIPGSEGTIKKIVGAVLGAVGSDYAFTITGDSKLEEDLDIRGNSDDSILSHDIRRELVMAPYNVYDPFGILGRDVSLFELVERVYSSLGDEQDKAA